MNVSASGRFATVRDRLSRALDASRLVGATRTAEATAVRWGRGSRIVRWFLAEPDPEVVVVDLRETYTVGPVIHAAAWSGTRARRLAERSGLDAAASKAADRFRDAPLRSGGAVVVATALVGIATSLLAGGAVGGWLLLLGVALLATRERRSASELAETRLGRALVAAFEPPEPPERDGG